MNDRTFEPRAKGCYGNYEEFGDTTKAVTIYHRVLAAVPDFTAATRRLEELQ